MAGVYEIPSVIWAILIQVRGEAVGTNDDLVLRMLGQLLAVELAHGKDGVDGGRRDGRPPIKVLTVVQPNIARFGSGTNGD